MQLPLPIEIKGKNVFIRTLAVVVGFILILIAYVFYKEYYDDLLCVIFTVAGLALIFAGYGVRGIVNNSWSMPNSASLTITQQSVRFHSKPFKALGEIYWRDVADVKEIAQGTKGRTFRFFVKDPAVYLDNMQSSSLRKSLKKVCADNGGALFFIDSNKEYNAADLKETFIHLININK